MKNRVALKTSAKEMASARDYECPICMMLMIEPVLLPCNHELCYKCFILSYTNTNDQCPFCRVRIATWARKAMRTKRVINTAKWDLIQQLFPERIRCITEGRDIISDEEEAEMQIIAEDGSLGKEYMAELEKIESERLKASQEEEAASLAMIEKLCQAEGQPFTLPPVKMDSTSSSDVVAAAGMPNDRTYSITDEDRLKQIKEEEEASLRLIQQLQEEEERLRKERQKCEDLDRHYARLIAAALNKPPPKEPVVDPNDCVICPSSPCAPLKSAFTLDASSSASSATASSAASSGSSDTASSSASSYSSAIASSASTAGVLPTTPSTSCAELPGSATHMSTEATDKVVVTPKYSIYGRCETSIKGKKSATKTGLTKWLKMSPLPEAAPGSNLESGMHVLDLQPASTAVIDHDGTVLPIQTNTSCTRDLAAESSCTVSGPNVTGDASQRDRISDAFAAFVQSDLASNEHPERSSAAPEAIFRNTFASEVDPAFGFDLLEVLYQRNELSRELTSGSDSTGIRSNGALSYPGQPNEIPATDNAMECSASQNSDSLPAASGSRMKETKKQGVKRGLNGDATGTLGNTPACSTPSSTSAVSARGRKSSRGRSSAGATPARKSLKRSIVYINDDPEPCCSTSSTSSNSPGSAMKKMCLNWSDTSMSSPQISAESDTFADIPAVAKSDFDSEESYRLYLEEQDHQVALRLQQMFDLESSRPAQVPKSAEPGGYNLRCRAKPSTNSQEEI